MRVYHVLIHEQVTTRRAHPVTPREEQAGGPGHAGRRPWTCTGTTANKLRFRVTKAAGQPRAKLWLVGQ